MRIAYTHEQEALRTELEQYFSGLMTESVRDELSRGEGDYGGGDLYRELVSRMGRDGWLGIGWPTEYGGQNRSMVEQLIFTDEATKAGAPVPFLTINAVGPMIMNYGTEAQKRFFLPRILSGELHFSIGYSEPDAGTDLAALTTKAVRDGDEYIINGQKMWTSLIQFADYVWLAVRTNPEERRHKGLSVLLVPTDAPGFKWTPVPTVTGTTTSQTFYENVRVPVAALVGEENGGWALITGQLNRERVALCSAAGVQQSLLEVRRWAQNAQLPDGRRVIDQEWVQINLARVHAKSEFLKLINWKIAWGVASGVDPADASATKVFGTEFYTEAYRLLMECMGEDAYIAGGSPAAVVRGRVERALPVGSDPDIRGRHQRDSTGHHFDGRPRHAPGPPLMDFAFTEEQLGLAALAQRILTDRVTPDRLREIEGGPDRFDPDLWRTLAEADLLGIGLSEQVGGSGFGIIEQCLLLEQLGRRLAPVPFLASSVCAAGALARFGTAAQQATWAAPAVAGRRVLTVALAESRHTDLADPATNAVAEGAGYRLTGLKTAVPAGPLADLFLVSARVDSGEVGVFLVEKERPGMTVSRQATTNRESAAQVALADVRVPTEARLGPVGGGQAVLRWILERATVGLCALQLGITEQAVRDTADYTKTRVQFNRPIATFQAVGHRCADAYIDVEAVRLTLWQAAWRLAEGLPAATEVEVAKYWAAEAGHRVGHAAVHLHGGMGVASEYTTHRYFIWAKQIEFMLGGATQQLLRIGATLAAEPA